MDCRDPVAMDGTVKCTVISISTFLLCRTIHPCGLDPGNPCRDDGFFVVSYVVWVCDFLNQKLKQRKKQSKVTSQFKTFAFIPVTVIPAGNAEIQLLGMALLKLFK